MMRKIPNGTIIDVTGRVVKGDSTDCRSILAEFTYDGKNFTTEARWLEYSDTNPEGTVDLFANDNFSRTPEFVSKRLAFTHIKPLSEKGRWLYSLWMPALQHLLIFVACWLLFFKTKFWLSAVPFLLAILIQFFASLCMGDDYLWYCLPGYQGIVGAIVGFIPLLLFFFGECVYMMTIWIYSSTGIRIWPVFVAWLMLYPAVIIGFLLGSVWIGVAMAIAFPLLVNGPRCGGKGVAETLLLEIGIMGVVASFISVFLASWQIIAAVIGGVMGACMMVIVKLSNSFGNE